MANITITDIDLGSVMLEVWGKRASVLSNAELTEQTFAPGTILALSSADGKLYPYDPAAVADDIEIPKFILTYEVVIAASSDAQVEVISAGKVDQTRLVIHDGTALTAAMLDELMDRPFVLVDVTQLAKVDNPQ